MKRPFRTVWGENIRAARLAVGLTQVELCRRIGVTQQALSGWEQGIRAPRDEYRFLLARALRQPIHILFPAPGAKRTGGDEAAA